MKGQAPRAVARVESSIPARSSEADEEAMTMHRAYEPPEGLRGSGNSTLLSRSAAGMRVCVSRAGSDGTTGNLASRSAFEKRRDRHRPSTIHLGGRTLNPFPASR